MKLLNVLGLLFLPIFLLSQNEEKTDLGAFRDTTRMYIDNQRYEEALERCIWFHENAHDINKSYSSARLSYALRDWRELGRRYTPALLEMMNYRNMLILKFREDNESYPQFREILAFNRVLDEPHESISLFRELAERSEGKANLFWISIKDLAVEYEEYDLIRKYGYNFDYELNSLKFDLQMDENLAKIKSEIIDSDEYIDQSKDNFVKNVLDLIKLAKTLEDTVAAKKLSKEAYSVIPDERLKPHFDENKQKK